ncbi:hypothetical protein HH110_10660 [Stenotrophomonas sp. SAM-B]|uniref:hypothetical protein n=1 Tax=Stenotrophomonas sp. SAM-B TaxID=2729141 RepID=UPI00159F88F5|nr:hypothetical protein [Stenotrophomonas sp. SAM-B]NWF33499.1 hypothetical protein [Stenotrophomonas sp. SAM-B]
MTMEVIDIVSMTERIAALGGHPPAGLAILPENLATAATKSDLRQQVESDTVRTLLREHGIHFSEVFSDADQPPYLQQYSYEWFGPTLFVSASLLSQNPTALSVALGIITNYLYDLFKGATEGKASLKIVLERPDGTCKQIMYQGPAEGMSEIASIVDALEKGP